VIITFVISFGAISLTYRKEVLATVGSEEILIPQFQKRYQAELDKLRARNPANAELVARQSKLAQRLLNGMITRSLILKEAGQRGFQVTDLELEETLKTIPEFQVANRFDFNTYITLLRQNNLTPESYEAGLREDLLVRKYQQSMSQGVTVSTPEADQRFTMENEKVEVAYVYLDPEKFKTRVQVTEEQEKIFYSDNQRLFQEPEKFSLKTFVLSLDSMLSQESIPEKAIQRYYERHLEDEYSTPTQVRASHILKKIPANATPDQREKTTKAMESILAQAKAGQDFAALAKTQSDDLSRSQGGDLGYFGPGEMVPSFEAAAFGMKPGQISEIVPTQFGLHIIKVTGRREGAKKRLEEVRGAIRNKLLAERAERRLSIEADRLGGRISLEGIDKVAASMNAKVSITGLFTEDQTLASIGSAAPLYSLVRGRKTGESGVWRRNPVQGHLFYQIVDKKEAFVKPLDQVRSEVKAHVAQREAVFVAAEAGKKAFKEALPGGLEGFAKVNNLRMETTSFTAVDSILPKVGLDAGFQQTSFELSAQKPNGISSSGGKTYLIVFKGRKLPPAGKESVPRERLKPNLQLEWEQFFMEKEFERLKAQGDVEIVAPQVLTSF
ncbi:MAG: peptidylprolyl isomerase, partial [Deltaproteobacteria bacterium]|nr:peptidylprolyl isomerase [Deltaproteobacteria bacterium]